MTWNLCDCGCRPAGCAPGCPCRECQPGEGIKFRGRNRSLDRARQARLTHLLMLENPTPEQEAEADTLLHRFIYE